MTEQKAEQESNGASPDEKSATVKESWIPLLLIGVAALFRFFRLGHHSLWADEGFSLYMGMMELPSFFSFIAHHDAHPPLYYLLLHLLLPWGKSELFLRLPSAVFGIATVIITWLLAKKLFNASTALIALSLVALSASQIYVTQEMRMYPLFIMLSMLSTLYFYELMEKNEAKAVFYILSSVLMVYTHYLGFVILFSHFIAGLVLFRKLFTVKRMAMYLIVLLCYLPWVTILLVQVKTGTGPALLERASLLSVVNTFLCFFSGFTFMLRALSPEYFIILFCSVIFPVAGIFVMLRSPEKRTSLIFLLLYILLPIIILLSLSLLHIKNLYSVKYLSFSAPACFILLAWLLHRILTSNSRILAIVILLCYFFVNFISLYDWYFIPAFQKQRWREAIASVNQVKTDGDAFLIQDFFQIHCLQYYLGSEKDIYMVHPDNPDKTLEHISKSHWRIWYIASCGWRVRDPGLNVLHWLDKNMKLADEKYYLAVDGYSSILVHLYENREAPPLESVKKEREQVRK